MNHKQPSSHSSIHFIAMKVICLGTAGFHDTESLHTACYMFPELGIIFDAGSGFFRVPKLIQTNYLEIFMSHGHMDHTCGITILIEAFERTKGKDLTIYGLEDVLNSMSKFFEYPLFPVRPKIKFVPISAGDSITTKSGAIVSCFAVNHDNVPCLGYRLDHQNRSFAYVTDTTSSANSSYIPNISNVNLLFHEVYNNVANAEICRKFGHSDTGGFVDIWKAAKPERIAMIHHNPNLDINNLYEEVKKDIPNVELALDKSEFLI